VDIIFKGRHTDVQERFRAHAIAKLAKIAKLEHKAIRVDVELSAERNPRQSDRKERVELTVTSRGPAIRAEAAAIDRYAALDIAFGKLEARLRRANDRRKGRHGSHGDLRLVDHLPVADELASAAASNGVQPAGVADETGLADEIAGSGAEAAQETEPDVVSVQMEGDGPLVVREKFHEAKPMSIDQALFEMELVGHDFFLFTDDRSGLPSVVYKRRGYQYGVLRLLEEDADANRHSAERPAGHSSANSAGHPDGQLNGKTMSPADLAHG
jgi:ribosomal subunit interface protein